MGVFPRAQIIPNPYNKIPGFSCTRTPRARFERAPGFPVMAWPMMEWVLDSPTAIFFTWLRRWSIL
jgi:molybdopterin-biosynthesis enzyme MoeA-like protein